jgi:inner membrane protein
VTTNAAEVGQKLIANWARPVHMTAIAVLALLLLIPLLMVESVVRERYARYREVVAEIAGSWSGDQLLAGPILTVPFTERIEVREEYVTPQGEKKVSERWESRRRRAFVLPAALEIDGTLSPEKRHRGIYRVQVFTAELVVSGVFRDLEAAVAALSPAERLESIEWSEAAIGVGLSDPRGIVAADGFEINGSSALPKPGTGLGELLPRGFHVPVGGLLADSLEFRLPITLRGSGSLQFLPLGESTRAVIRSDWPHPSFVGGVLPATRQINEAGFSAQWTIPLLNRSYPQAWTDRAAVAIDEIEAGVRLFEPVALYDLVTRAVKYGLLFVALTFLTLGLVELVQDVRLRLVQFLLIGVALAIFFLILIALAEHMGFTLAYVLAASTVVAINTLYCAAILRRRSTALLVGAVLTAIYGILFVILEAEDFALLGGTLLLVAALSVTMYLTRRINEPQAMAG